MQLAVFKIWERKEKDKNKRALLSLPPIKTDIFYSMKESTEL